MSQRIFPNDPRIKWLGAISLDSNDEYVMPWRIPYEEIDLYNIDPVSYTHLTLPTNREV